MKFSTFNNPNLMQQFRGDEEILLDMIYLFKASLSELLNPIRESIFNKNGDELRLNAHTFKGVMGNFFAEEAKILAYELETRGQQSIFDDTLELLNKLENQLQLFLFELQELSKILDAKL